jgi:2,4-dienoyl-CoA reductase-like NADH-dependent reductase (Old Yellow Enzyme family)
MAYTRLAALRTPEQFSEHIRALGIFLDADPDLRTAPDSPLAQPYALITRRLSVTLSNRWCVLPMEGWDAQADGKPSDLTVRRWQRFGQSGAKLIWGGEAVAVRPDGRANPNQLIINEGNLRSLENLRQALIRSHAERWSTGDLLIGLQLTHSGRFCRPGDQKRLEPQLLYSHPILNPKFGLPPDHPVMTDSAIEQLIEDFIKAAVLAQKAGFQFVDIKHCHGYLGHEFLSAVDRPGKYGGSLENRMRFLKEITAGIHREAPGLEIGVRLSAFDFMPFHAGEEGVGIPDPTPAVDYPYAFGGDGTGTGIDLQETDRFLERLENLGIQLVNITGGSPYYNPHIQRPAMVPPSDGYLPPEDPLVGVARLINAAAELKARHPHLLIVGSGYSYLQEWLPHVAQNVIRTGKADFVGLGRMILSYPEMPGDVLEGRPLQRKRLCRTFSDCTSAPRNGLPSGCYPLDPFYKGRPEAALLAELKKTGDP